MSHCKMICRIVVKKDGVTIISEDLDYELDEVYRRYFECGTHVKRSISKKSDTELQEYTEWLAGYDDHIDNVVWEMRQALEDHCRSSSEIDIENVGEYRDSNLTSELVRFTGVFTTRSFVAANIQHTIL